MDISKDEEQELKWLIRFSIYNVYDTNSETSHLAHRLIGLEELRVLDEDNIGQSLLEPASN